MSSFKSGSGDLDFGEGDEEEEEETSGKTTKSSEQPSSAPPDRVLSETESSSGQPARTRGDADESAAADSSTEEYPYFVRRRRVGDERDTRLELNVRDKVADQEAQYRNELAEHLGVNEISKTDAREFALLAAFEHPERVAELMREEGFGSLG